MNVPNGLTGICWCCDADAEHLCDARQCLRGMCRQHTRAAHPGRTPDVSHLCHVHAADPNAERPAKFSRAEAS